MGLRKVALDPAVATRDGVATVVADGALPGRLTNAEVLDNADGEQGVIVDPDGLHVWTVRDSDQIVKVAIADGSEVWSATVPASHDIRKGLHRTPGGFYFMASVDNGIGNSNGASKLYRLDFDGPMLNDLGQPFTVDWNGEAFILAADPVDAGKVWLSQSSLLSEFADDDLSTPLRTIDLGASTGWSSGNVNHRDASAAIVNGWLCIWNMFSTYAFRASDLVYGGDLDHEDDLGENIQPRGVFDPGDESDALLVHFTQPALDDDAPAIVRWSPAVASVANEADGLPTALQDADRAKAEAIIAVSEVGTGWSTISARFIADHTYIGDLVIELESPTGTIHTLHNRSGGSGDGPDLTVDVSANFTDEDADGEWIFRATDFGSGDTGDILTAELTFDGGDPVSAADLPVSIPDSGTSSGEPLVVVLDGDLGRSSTASESELKTKIYYHIGPSAPESWVDELRPGEDPGVSLAAGDTLHIRVELDPLNGENPWIASASLLLDDLGNTGFQGTVAIEVTSEGRVTA